MGYAYATLVSLCVCIERKYFRVNIAPFDIRIYIMADHMGPLRKSLIGQEYPHVSYNKAFWSPMIRHHAQLWNKVTNAYATSWLYLRGKLYVHSNSKLLPSPWVNFNVVWIVRSAPQFILLALRLYFKFVEKWRFCDMLKSL